ncbi:MAG TPA: DUF1648 domain-containing protein [Candidatus Limnocylindrales bacterium]|nr:DUF1648 domain-containing protein [Candidatus Limnocylindrales bacterium]
MTAMSSLDPQSATRRRTAAWVTAVGLAVLAGAAAVALSWRAQLPHPVASHWGVDGTADGFSSLNGVLAVMLGFGIALVLGFGAVTLLLGQSAVTRRIGAAAAIWSALFMCLLTLGTLYIQRGLTDARDAGGIGAVVLAAIVGSLLPAVAVGALVPGDPRLPASEAVAADAPRAELAAGERTTWTARTDAGAAMGVGIVAVAVLLALVVVTRVWALLIVVGLLGILIVSMFRWVVRVDGTGLAIRSAIGWPRVRVPLDEVVRADVIQVRALRDFGGWGLRVGRGGRVGVVLRSGEAMLVQRTGGRSVAVTVDGAATGAGVLNALADRARRA